MLAQMSEVWSAGTYERLAARFAPVQDELVNQLRIEPGERVLDLATGTGEVAVRAAARGAVVTGIDVAEPMLVKARRRAEQAGAAIAFDLGDIEYLPYDDGSFDVVVSNGVINLSPVKHRVFAEAARVLRPGGRLAIADIVSARPLRERTRRNVELWAACIAGAIPRDSYVRAMEAAGLRVQALRVNDYDFISERALDACSTYGVESISLGALRA